MTTLLGKSLEMIEYSEIQTNETPFEGKSLGDKMLLELAGSWRMGRGRGGSPRLVVDEATRLFRLSQKGIRFCLREFSP